MKKDTTYQAVKIYIMNILLQKGYETVEEQALNVFTEMFLRYTQNIGIIGKKLANLGNRNTSNIVDVLFSANLLNIDFEHLLPKEELPEESNKLDTENRMLRQNQQQTLKSKLF